jgi:hypothetical protein
MEDFPAAGDDSPQATMLLKQTPDTIGSWVMLYLLIPYFGFNRYEDLSDINS